MGWYLQRTKFGRRSKVSKNMRNSGSNHLCPKGKTEHLFLGSSYCRQHDLSLETQHRSWLSNSWLGVGRFSIQNGSIALRLFVTPSPSCPSFISNSFSSSLLRNPILPYMASAVLPNYPNRGTYVLVHNMEKKKKSLTCSHSAGVYFSLATLQVFL